MSCLSKLSLIPKTYSQCDHRTIYRCTEKQESEDGGAQGVPAHLYAVGRFYWNRSSIPRRLPANCHVFWCPLAQFERYFIAERTRDGMNAARRVAVDHKLAGEHPIRRRISLSQLGQKIGGSHGWLPTPLLPLPAHSPEKRMTDGNFGQISEACRTSGGVEKWNSMVPSRSQVQTSCAPASK